MISQNIGLSVILCFLWCLKTTARSIYKVLSRCALFLGNLLWTARRNVLVVVPSMLVALHVYFPVSSTLTSPMAIPMGVFTVLLLGISPLSRDHVISGTGFPSTLHGSSTVFPPTVEISSSPDPPTITGTSEWEISVKNELETPWTSFLNNTCHVSGVVVNAIFITHVTCRFTHNICNTCHVL